MVIVAIVGSREFKTMLFVEELLHTLSKGDVVVISGNARGVDQHAETVARRLGFEVKSFPADWEKHGKRAGFIRNAELVAEADVVFAFWDGKSKGTMDTVERARHACKPVFICRDQVTTD